MTRLPQQRMAPTKTHACVAPGCEVLLPKNLLMCRTHWLQVPRVIRWQVWETYKRNPGGDDHKAAMIAARDSLEPPIAPNDRPRLIA